MTKQASTEHREDYLQLNQYKLMGMVGQGSYSIVKMAYNMDEDTHYVRFIINIIQFKKNFYYGGIFPLVNRKYQGWYLNNF